MTNAGGKCHRSALVPSLFMTKLRLDVAAKGNFNSSPLVHLQLHEFSH